MKELAPDVFHLSCLPGLPYAVNAYLAGDVLIDAGTRQSTKRLQKQIGDRAVTAHALTHAHPDHQGASHEICEQRDIPFLVSEADKPAAEDSSLIRRRQPDKFMAKFFDSIFVGPSHPVDRTIGEGDEVAGFEVLEVPGHSAGHVAFWRESDRVLILGDVLANMDQYSGIPGLHTPKDALTPDPARNRESARRLAALEPELALFGHGAPLRDPAKLSRFVEGLPA
jgi:hydroxyacylglutathione hydrolase